MGAASPTARVCQGRVARAIAAATGSRPLAMGQRDLDAGRLPSASFTTLKRLCGRLTGALEAAHGNIKQFVVSNLHRGHNISCLPCPEPAPERKSPVFQRQ